MATAGEMTKIVAEALALPEATVISYQTMLRKAGLMTMGGRGRSAPQMTPLDIARLIIALMGSDALADAVAVVELWGALEYIFADAEHIPSELDDIGLAIFDDLLGRHNFESAVAELIQANATRRQGKRTASWFGFKLDGHDLTLNLTASALEASIIVGPFQFQYRRTSEPANPAPPDEWYTLPAKERLVARAGHPGMRTLRSLGHIELYVACGAALEHPEKYPHH